MRQDSLVHVCYVHDGKLHHYNRIVARSTTYFASSN